MSWKTNGPILLALASFVLAGAAFAASFPFSSMKIGLYKNKSFTEKVTAFTPDEKIYLLVDLQQLQPGSFTLTTDWLTPWGEFEHQSNYSFEVTEVMASWKAYSWLAFRKNGPVKSFLLGEDVKKEFYGTWTVRLYLNGQQIRQQTFDVR